MFIYQQNFGSTCHKIKANCTAYFCVEKVRDALIRLCLTEKDSEFQKGLVSWELQVDEWHMWLSPPFLLF